MKVYRYMSKKEFRAMKLGYKMVPYNMHHNANTNSTGFCFLAEKTRVDAGYQEAIYNPLQCFSFLSGIVSDAFLTEFEAPDVFRKTWGVYASPFSFDWNDRCTATELCCDTYDTSVFVPLRYIEAPCGTKNSKMENANWTPFFESLYDADWGKWDELGEILVQLLERSKSKK